MKIYTIFRLPGLKVVLVDYGWSGLRRSDGSEIHSGTAIKAYWGHCLHNYRCWVLS